MKHYFTIAGFEIDKNTVAMAIGAVMSESEIVELGREQAALLGTSLPERESYDGELFDASLDLLNNENRFLYAYDCDGAPDAFIAQADKIGAGHDAWQLVNAWRARQTSH